jgi:acetoacetate decarboxylase
MQGLTRYGFRQAASGFFEFPTENARRILPAHVEPVELHHGTAIFSLTAFDFTESMVGPYGEVVMSVIVSPLVKPGKPLPKAAFYPYLVGTTTRAAREHAIERWHLPHWMADVEMTFTDGPREVTARVVADGDTVAEMTIGDYEWHPVSHLYQSFMHDADGTYLANITMEGQHSEHEEETGRLKLFPHAFNKSLGLADVSEVPFREMWMREGRQTFEPLIQLETA